MSILRSLFLGFIVIFLSQSSGAVSPSAPLSPGEKLRRLSLILVGSEPSEKDRQDLFRYSSPQQIHQFLEATARKYVKSEAFAAKVVEKFSEIAGWPSPTLPAEQLWNRNFGNDYKNKILETTISTSHNLLRTVITQNASWDQILLSRKFLLPQGTFDLNYLTRQDASILSGFFDENSKSKVEREDQLVIVPPKDVRFAGIISFQTFLDATGPNSNGAFYGRAARILKMFHCEDLKIGSLPNKADTFADQLTEHGVPKVEASVASSPTPGEAKRKAGQVSQTQISSAPAAHGANIQCRVCHNKLDPISDLYQPVEQDFLSRMKNIPPKATKVKLLFADGSTPEAEGLLGLGQAISRSPLFGRCQSARFVRWFTPGAPELDANERSEVAKKFEELGRRPQDFVVWAVMRDLERRSAPSSTTANDEQFPRAQEFGAMMQKCVSCHRDSKNTPDFSTFISRTKEAAVWADRIEKATNLPGNGVNAQMPPASMERLHARELEVLRQWVAFQRDEKPKSTDERKAFASSKKWACYPSPQDYARRFAALFGHLQAEKVKVHSELKALANNLCDLNDTPIITRATDSNTKIEKRVVVDSPISLMLGRLQADSGEQPYQDPHAGFSDWYKGCVENLTLGDVFTSLISEDPQVYRPSRYLPQTVIEMMNAFVPPPPPQKTSSFEPFKCSSCRPLQGLIDHVPLQHLGRLTFLQREWKTIGSGSQVEVILHIVDRLFPSGSLEDGRYYRLVERVIGTSNVKLQKHSILSAIVQIQKLVLIGRDFLFVDPLCERGAQ